jgi:guanine nucleotide-binding protein subunit beta-2-like 1 protein
MADGAFIYEGQLSGHCDWVTAVACPDDATGDGAFKVLSASRDKSVTCWTRDGGQRSAGGWTKGRRLEGHSGFVQDLALSNDGKHALTASWDRSLRLWRLDDGEVVAKFNGNTKDVLSVCFSPDNRLVVSGGRDNKLRVWNVKGECVHTFGSNTHSDWISCVRFSPVSTAGPILVSASWDHTVKVWDLSDFSCKHTLHGHTGYVSTVTVSPDGSLCASAGKDGDAKLWDLAAGKLLYDLQCGEPINQVAFSPTRYWLCAATETMIRVFDLENKCVVADLIPETQLKSIRPECISMAWAADGRTLYSGYTDNTVRIWAVAADRQL